MASQPGIVLYRLEYASIRGKLSYEQKGRLIDALMDFSETGEEYQGDDPFVSMAFSFFSAAIRRSAEKYERRRKANQENIEKRWHKDEDDPDSDDTKDTNGTDGIPTIPMEPTKPTVTNPTEPKRKRTQTVFVPPSVEEVAEYCRERGNRIDPETFVSYYQRQGWELSNGRKMRDWKAAIITWENNRKEEHNELRPGCRGNQAPGQRSEYKY